MSDARLRLYPLGGLGEVGMNCLALELHDESGPGDMVIVDVGVTFPERTHGIDLAHPRFDAIVARQDRLRAILITHGHEDHIGAVGYLLKKLKKPVPVYGPAYALGLIEGRFDELDLELPEMHRVQVGRTFEVGHFVVEPYRVNHSIPDCTGLILRTPAGTVIHSGDYKMEDAPVDGEQFGFPAIERAAEEGVDLLLSDSTNVDAPGSSGEEADVAEAIDTLLADAQQRVVVAQFASNVYRMRAVFEAARKHDRRVVLLGRSVEKHYALAEQLGHLPDGAAELVVDRERAHKVRRDRLVAIATGTQGEAPAALSRLARGEHPDLTLEPGDTIVLSSRIIPGMEATVFQLLDQLERLGCEVLHRRTHPNVHVSGHAYRGEQERLIRAAKPRAFMPVHGTFHMLRAHSALGRELGVETVLAVENGTVVELDDGDLRIVDQVTTGRVHVDRGYEIADEMLTDRRRMGELGVAFVAAQVDHDLRMRVPPEVTTRGFIDIEDEEKLIDELISVLQAEMERFHDDLEDLDDVEDQLRRSVRRFFGRRFRRRPIVVAMALEAS